MKTKYLTKNFFSLLMAVCMVGIMLVGMSVKVYAAENIAIDATNFPDEAFRKYVCDKFDKDKNEQLSEDEITKVTQISVNKCNISSMKGIENFICLKTLYCSNNQLTLLDISKNTLLEQLFCGDNQLTSLDVSKNTALTVVSCGYNQLSSLDVSQNTKLENLACGYNKLASLDVSKNTALAYLSCSGNQLTVLDFSNNAALMHLYCDNNQLTVLNVSSNAALMYLYCYCNQLTVLDVSRNTELTELSCFNNQLTSLDVSNNTKLSDMTCGSNMYAIHPKGETFDLSTLPGDFHVSKASEWTNGTVNGNILTIEGGADQVTCQYDCGNNLSVTFTLKISRTHTYGSEWNKDDKNHWHECSCGEKADVTAHVFDAGNVTKEPTQTEAGVMTYICKECGAQKAESIPATGSTSGDGKTEGTSEEGKNAGDQKTESNPAAGDVSVPAIGTILTDPVTKAKYKVTNNEAGNRTVAYVKPLNSKVSTVTIPATITIDGITYKVTAIEKNAFKNNKTLKKIVIGSNVTKIGDNAFYGCIKLKYVTIGKNVTTIGNKAFYKCKALKSITIPSKVEKIGKQAFYGCKNLKKITIKTKKLTNKRVGSKAFKGIHTKAKIKVPKSKKKAYKSMLKKKGIGKKLTIYKHMF